MASGRPVLVLHLRTWGRHRFRQRLRLQGHIDGVPTMLLETRAIAGALFLVSNAYITSRIIGAELCYGSSPRSEIYSLRTIFGQSLQRSSQ